jgi:uncharacterized protein (DUF1501 family)
VTNEKHTECGGCDEYRDLSRRSFLRGTGLATAAGATLPAWFPRVTFAAPGAPARDVMVHVFMRGAADGLSIVVPHGDPHLYNLRPTLAVPQPGQPDGALDLDGFFGLNPNCAALLGAYNNGDLAVLHAAGSTDPTRSHFDGFKAVEGGVPNQNLTHVKDGWLGRHIRDTQPWGPGFLRGLAIEPLMPIYMSGADQALPILDPPTFEFPGRPETAGARRFALESIFAAADEPMKSSGASTLGTMDLLATIDFENYTSAGGVPYPNSYFGNQLRMTAAMIKGDIGVEAFGVDYDGWDHHENQGPITGLLANMLSDLTASLEAFYLDLRADGWLDSTVIFLMSEFGRRAEENVSGGTDHGHGNMMMAIGGHIAGGQVFANWPGLGPNQLVDGDLDITIDYRDVVGEILVNRMGNTNLPEIFPNHTLNPIGITT